MVDGNFNPRSYKGRQPGNGIAGMYSKKPYTIPVNPHITVEEPKEIFGKQVTPMVAVEERAKEDLKEEMRDNVPHVPVDSIKAENVQKSHSSPTIRKKKLIKKAVPSHITSRKHKSEVTNLDSNIFRSKKTKTKYFKNKIKVMSFLSEKITEIGLSAELYLFTVPPNQVAVEKYILRNTDQSQHKIQKMPDRNFHTRSRKRIH